jgi:hypothetical protein
MALGNWRRLDPADVIGAPVFRTDGLGFWRETSANTTSSRDTGAGTRDTNAGTRDTDAGTRDTDAGTRDTDAGTRDTGAGTRDTDAGTRDTGAGTRDTGTGTCDTSAGTRDAAEGTCDTAEGAKRARQHARSVGPRKWSTRCGGRSGGVECGMLYAVWSCGWQSPNRPDYRLSGEC